jgi:hypothetical protein
LPEFTYAGQMPRHYTETRDTAGELLGLIQQGDVRDLDEAPADGLWVEGDVKVAAAPEGVGPDMYRQEPAPAPGEADESAESDDGEDAPAPAAKGRAGRGKAPGGDTSTPDGTSSEEQG